MVEFRILGPFEVVEHDQPVVLGGPKQRALLVALLLHRGEVVSIDRLIDELWGERPPATAAKTLQVYVSNLRKALGDGLLVTRGHGYLLQSAPGQLDLDRFEVLVGEGRQALEEGDARRASDRLREALVLWRGPPLADFAYERFAQSEIMRLEEERLAALEDRIDADLALGKHTVLVGELDALVREHPLRERLQAQLMLALYRSGRQADALERYQDARRVLIDQLGIEPGPELKELERAILAQDRSLQPPPATLRSPQSSPDAGPPWRSWSAPRCCWSAAIAAALLTGGGARALPSLQPNSLGLIDPATGHLRESVSIAGTPARVHVSGRQVWVTSDDARTVSLVDAGSTAIARVVPIGEFPSDFAVGEGAVWVIDRVLGRLVKISPDYGTIVGTATIGSRETLSATDDRYDLDPWSIAAGAGGVWITDGSSLLRRADPSSGKIVHRYDVRVPLNGVAVGDGCGVGDQRLNGQRAADRPAVRQGHRANLDRRHQGRRVALSDRDRDGPRVGLGAERDRRERNPDRSCAGAQPRSRSGSSGCLAALQSAPAPRGSPTATARSRGSTRARMRSRRRRSPARYTTSASAREECGSPRAPRVPPEASPPALQPARRLRRCPTRNARRSTPRRAPDRAT